MPSEYLTKPPLILGRGKYRSFWKELLRIVKGFVCILWQTIVPFNPSPELPKDPPNPDDDPDDKQIEQCEKMFDRVEEGRDQLEQKARATFSFVSFLTPLLASILVFTLSKTPADTPGRSAAIVLSVVSLCFLVLGFVSIARAVSVRGREALFLDSIIDPEQNQIRAYDKRFYIRGLLYCASVNQAINDHIAQFVKGAHVLTALAVLALVPAAVPAAIALSSISSQPTKTEIIGQVAVSVALAPLEKEIAKIGDQVSAMAAAKTSDDRLNQLTLEIADLKAQVAVLQTASHPTTATRSVKNKRSR
jgi:hypothetical protein